MSFGFQGQWLNKIIAILLSAVCFTGMGTREALASPYQTYWDCSDNLYDCQAADLVPELAQLAHTVRLYIPEGKVMSYHYKDLRTKNRYDSSYTEILVSYDDRGQQRQVASVNVPIGGEAGGELIAPRSDYYYLTIQCYYGGDCDGSGYLRTSK